MENHDQFIVYFGDTDTDMQHVFKVAVYEKLNFGNDAIPMFYNSDRQCAKLRQFDPDEPAIAIYFKNGADPSVLQSPKDFKIIESYEVLKLWVSL